MQFAEKSVIFILCIINSREIKQIMSWTKILLLLAIIALLHVVVIYGCVYSGKDDGEKSGIDPVLAEAIFNSIFTAAKDAPQPSEDKVSHHQKPAPWDYSRTLALPHPLARQAARAKSVIIVDLGTRRVLYERNARNKVAIASLTKLMTLLVVSDQISANDKLDMNNVVEISSTAAGVENARLKRGSYTIRDLMYSMIVGSFNDAATQLAIVSHGDVKTFVNAMNQRAADMGFTKAAFNSPSGLPQNKINSFASAEEVLFLCEAVMQEPELKQICNTPRYKLSRGAKRYGGNEIGSPNQLINGRNVKGAFGFKTGFTNAAGRCVAFGVERDGRVILCCITGYPANANNALFDFSVNLINWAYKQSR